MIYIVKKHEPRELTEYRESESSTGVRPTYDSMSSDLHVQNSRNRQKNRKYIEVYD